jgi:hypothetical protein
MNQNRKDSFESLLRRHLSSEMLSKGTSNLCPDENGMTAYLEGTQAERFNSDFEKHLLNCVRCQAELALLLKSGAISEESAAAKLATAPEAKPRRSLASFWSNWLKIPAFRPAFAILIVSLVSGVIGYRLIQEQQRSARSEQVAQSMQKDNASPVPPGLNSGGLQPSSTSSRREASSREETSDLKQNLKGPVIRNQGTFESERKDASARSALEKSKAERTDKDANEARDERYAAEPVADALSQSEGAEFLNQARTSAPPQAASPREDSETVSKESVSSQEGRQQSDFGTTAARSAEDGRDTSGERSSGKPRRAAVPAAPAANALSKTDREKVTERDDQTEAADSRAKREKKQSLEGERRETLGLAVGTPRRIEAGGKLFELRGDLWRDSTISESGQVSPVVVRYPSPEFESLRKDLVPYQPVLSRPEDVLMKLNDRIYRIKKIQKTPN